MLDYFFFEMQSFETENIATVSFQLTEFRIHARMERGSKQMKYHSDKEMQIKYYLLIYASL